MRIDNFKSWLNEQGCEILPITNEFEVIRFRSKNGTGVVYKGKRGYSVSSDLVTKAYDCFVSNKKWSGKGKPTKRISGSKKKREIVDRDGLECFYCAKEMTPSETTIEHLHAICKGGKDTLDNMVLSCHPCNLEAGNMPIIDKVKLRDSKMRAKNEI